MVERYFFAQPILMPDLTPNPSPRERGISSKAIVTCNESDLEIKRMQRTEREQRLKFG